MDGYLLVGVCMGCKKPELRSYVDKKTNENKTFREAVLGISVSKFGGFPSERETVYLKISEAQIDAGLVELFNSLIDKRLTLSIYQRPWISAKGNLGLETKLSGDGHPLLED